MGWEAGHIIDQIGADGVAAQLPDVGCGEVEMRAEAVEIIDDCAPGYVGPGEGNDVWECKRNAVPDFCVEGIGHARTPERGEGIGRERRAVPDKGKEDEQGCQGRSHKLLTRAGRRADVRMRLRDRRGTEVRSGQDARTGGRDGHPTRK